MNRNALGSETAKSTTAGDGVSICTSCNEEYASGGRELNHFDYSLFVCFCIFLYLLCCAVVVGDGDGKDRSKEDEGIATYAGCNLSEINIIGFTLWDMYDDTYICREKGKRRKGDIFVGCKMKIHEPSRTQKSQQHHNIICYLYSVW